jgi:hypothetical protein
MVIERTHGEQYKVVLQLCARSGSNTKRYSNSAHTRIAIANIACTKAHIRIILPSIVVINLTHTDSNAKWYGHKTHARIDMLIGICT